eukprot:1357041-Heterocapsa_arctica.AAC.1
MAVLTLVPSPIDEWHGIVNSKCRDVGSSQQWLLGQLRGGFMAHLFQIIAILSDPTVLKECVFGEACPEDKEACTIVD